MFLGVVFDIWHKGLALCAFFAAIFAFASLLLQTKVSQRVLFTFNVLAALIGAAAGIISYFVSKASGDETNKKIAETMLKSSNAENDAAQARKATVLIEGENIRLQTRLEEERAARLKLEEQIRPRRLSEVEKTFIVKAISPFAGQSIRVEQQTGDREIKEYAQDFAEVFRKAKWKLEGGISTGISEIHMDVDRGGTMLYVLASEMTPPSPAVIALQKILLEIGALTEPKLQAEDPRNELKSGGIQIRILKKQ